MFDVVVFASGRGSNLAALLEAQRRGAPFAIRALLADKPGAAALDIARNAGVPAMAFSPRDFPDRAAFDRAMFGRAAEFKPNLIVLAGYMRVIDTAVIDSWRGKVVNIHPSLLPKYPGLHTHERALAAADAEHGSSVHFVTAELDGGPVVAQAHLTIEPGDTPESLAARLLPLEHRLIVASVELIACGRVALDRSGVRLDGEPLRRPLRLGDAGLAPG